MDIATHAVMGLALASPLYVEHPLPAVLFALGTVLPDIDALSRAFGRRAFLAFHQTWTHSLAGAAAAALLLHLLLAGLGAGVASAGATAALLGGIALHVALDWANTYGVAWLLPLSRRRRRGGWLFFIDSVVISATVAACVAAVVLVDTGGRRPPALALAYLATLALYVAVKAALLRRAWRLAPADTVTLVPSGLLPWAFFGYARGAAAPDRVATFRLDARGGAVSARRSLSIHDGDPALVARLAQLSEFRTMRALSPAYHVVARRPRGGGATGGEVVVCRDLRTRNFNTRFGELVVELGPGAARPAIREFRV